MVTLENIIDAYFRARENKKKSPDQVKFQLHWEKNCVELWKKINSRKFKPRTYAFITKVPKPREIFACDMATRIIHHYIDIRTRDIMENILGPNTYNNRVGFGTSGAIRSVQKYIYEESNRFKEPKLWIIKLDLKACFPSIPREKACNYFLSTIMPHYSGPDKEDLIYMIKTCMLYDPCTGCDKRGDLSDWNLIPDYKSLFKVQKGYGAAIGHLIWQNAVNLYFHPLDLYIENLPGIKYTRYVDDLYIITKNKNYFLSRIPEIRKILKSLDAKLNEDKFYCQDYRKGVECLGYHIKLQRLHLNNRIIWRAKHKEPEIQSLNSYLGLCKFGSGFKIARKLGSGHRGLRFDKEHIKVIKKQI